VKVLNGQSPLCRHFRFEATAVSAKVLSNACAYRWVYAVPIINGGHVGNS
jgi:hypothetical protein